MMKKSPKKKKVPKKKLATRPTLQDKKITDSVSVDATESHGPQKRPRPTDERSSANGPNGDGGHPAVETEGMS